MTGGTRLNDWGELFVTLSLYLPVNSVLILGISSLVVAESPLAAGVGFLTLPALMTCIYVIDRWSVSEEDRINDPDRTALIEEHSRSLLALAVASLAVFEFSLWSQLLSRGVAGVALVALGHLPLAVLALYDAVKSCPVPLDSVAVGFAWSIEVVYIFAFLAPQGATGTELLVLFGCWFLLVFAGVEARNAEDVAGDAATGKATLAVLLGEGTIRWLTMGSKAVGVAVLTVVSGSPLVFALTVVHLGSLRFYRRLETEYRDASGPGGSGAIRSQYRESDEHGGARGGD